jgi:hypothetical protein
MVDRKTLPSYRALCIAVAFHRVCFVHRIYEFRAALTGKRSVVLGDQPARAAQGAPKRLFVTAEKYPVV